MDAFTGFLIIIGGIFLIVFLIRWIFQTIVRGVTRLAIEEAKKQEN